MLSIIYIVAILIALYFKIYEICSKSYYIEFLLTAWKKKHASGHMSYSKGFLTVGVEGYYYIYSQINYVDGRSAMTGYIIYIEETPVIKAVNSVISKMRKFDTNYIGGVFYIRSGQRISVRTPFKQKMYYSATRAYFGAFMVHP